MIDHKNSYFVAAVKAFVKRMNGRSVVAYGTCSEESLDQSGRVRDTRSPPPLSNNKIETLLSSSNIKRHNTSNINYPLLYSTSLYRMD